MLYIQNLGLYNINNHWKIWNKILEAQIVWQHTQNAPGYDIKGSITMNITWEEFDDPNTLGIEQLKASWERCNFNRGKAERVTKGQHKSEAVLENEMHKFLWDFEIQTDHPIQARRPDLVLINEKKITCHLVDYAMSVDHSESKENQKDVQISGPCQRAEKAVEYESDSNTNYSWSPWNSPQESGKETQWTGD